MTTTMVSGVRRRLTTWLAIVAMMASSLLLGSVKTAGKADANWLDWYYDAGKGDYIWVFNASHTAWLNQNLSWFKQHPGDIRICDYLYLVRGSKLCAISRGIGAVRWARVRWFISDAARWGECGLWIYDDRHWPFRDTIRAAEGTDGLGITRVGYRGDVVHFNGRDFSVRCPPG